MDWVKNKQDMASSQSNSGKKDAMDHTKAQIDDQNAQILTGVDDMNRSISPSSRTPTHSPCDSLPKVEEMAAKNRTDRTNLAGSEEKLCQKLSLLHIEDVVSPSDAADIHSSSGTTTAQTVKHIGDKPQTARKLGSEDPNLEEAPAVKPPRAPFSAHVPKTAKPRPRAAVYPTPITPRIILGGHYPASEIMQIFQRYEIGAVLTISHTVKLEYYDLTEWKKFISPNRHLRFEMMDTRETDLISKFTETGKWIDEMLGDVRKEDLKVMHWRESRAFGKNLSNLRMVENSGAEHEEKTRVAEEVTSKQQTAEGHEAPEAFINPLGKNLLIQCQMGISRSATMLLAYLMSRTRVPYTELKSNISSLRSINPNSGFAAQLKIWEECEYQLHHPTTDDSAAPKLKEPYQKFLEANKTAVALRSVVGFRPDWERVNFENGTLRTIDGRLIYVSGVMKFRDNKSNQLLGLRRFGEGEDLTAIRRFWKQEFSKGREIRVTSHAYVGELRFTRVAKGLEIALERVRIVWYTANEDPESLKKELINCWVAEGELSPTEIMIDHVIWKGKDGVIRGGALHYGLSQMDTRRIERSIGFEGVHKVFEHGRIQTMGQSLPSNDSEERTLENSANEKVEDKEAVQKEDAENSAVDKHAVVDNAAEEKAEDEKIEAVQKEVTEKCTVDKHAAVDSAAQEKEEDENNEAVQKEDTEMHTAEKHTIMDKATDIVEHAQEETTQIHEPVPEEECKNLNDLRKTIPLSKAGEFWSKFYNKS